MKQNLFDSVCIALLQMPISWSIDFKTRTFVLDHLTIIKDGKLSDKFDEYEIELPVMKLYESMPLDDAMEWMEQCFYRYHHSKCNDEREDRVHYFDALSYDDQSDEDRLTGEPRDYTRFILEYSMLALMICGPMNVWPEAWKQMKHPHFHCSERQPKLCIRREWIEPNYKPQFN